MAENTMHGHLRSYKTHETSVGVDKLCETRFDVDAVTETHAREATVKPGASYHSHSPCVKSRLPSSPKGTFLYAYAASVKMRVACARDEVRAYFGLTPRTVICGRASCSTRQSIHVRVG